VEFPGREQDGATPSRYWVAPQQLCRSTLCAADRGAAVGVLWRPLPRAMRKDQTRIARARKGLKT